VAPKRVGTLDGAICKILMNGLVTRFCTLPDVAKKYLLKNGEQWGKLHCLEGRDIMHACDIVPKCRDSRDVSFIRMRNLIATCFQ
jgi:hypothetical protein